MIKVEITHDTIVRFAKGSVIEVSENEALRLIAFGNAKEVKPTQAPKKAAPAKKK